MPELTWETTEFKKHEKSRSWYVSLWIMAAALGVVGFMYGGFLVVVLVVLATFVVHLYAAKEPRTVVVSLSEEDLTIGEQTFPLGEFVSFWIFQRRDHDVLSLHRKGMTKPGFHVLVPPQKTPTVRMLLRPHVPEEEHDESLIDALADRLKF